MNRSLFTFFSILSPMFFTLLWAQLPPWALNPAEAYAPALYEVALGRGPSQQEAEIQAYASLARRYGVNISVQTTASEQAVQSGKEAVVIYSLDDKTGVQASHELFAARIAHIHHQEGAWTVLAVQDKKLASSLLQQRIAAQGQRALDLYTRSSLEADPIFQSRLLLKAAAEAEKSQPYIEQLAVLQGGVPAQSLPAQTLRARAEALLAAVTFTLEGDIPLALRERLEKSLGDLGYKLSPKPLYLLKTQWDVLPGRRLYGLYIAPYRLRIDIQNQAGSTLRPPILIEGKSQGEDAEDAARMALLHLSKSITDTFKKEFSQKEFL